MASINEKYVKQTYDVLCNSNLNLEFIAIHISKLPVREQRKFFRLLLNYIDLTASRDNGNIAPVGLTDIVELCNKLMPVILDHIEEMENQE